MAARDREGPLSGRRAPGARDVRRAAEALRRGAILAHPTSTVYGLGALDPALDAIIAGLKGRPPGRPLLRIAASLEALEAAHPRLFWDARARRLAEATWPGPLTLILADGTPSGLAVRVDAHPAIRAVLEHLGSVTMSSTSLNPSGSPPARTPDDVRDFLERLESTAHEVAFLNAGPLPPSPPSTIVSLVETQARLVREGAVDVGTIERLLGGEVAR